MAVRRETVIVDADVNPFVRKMGTASGAALGFARNLDEAESSSKMLLQTAAAMVPALLPIGAVGIPVIAGLTTQLGFAVGAAGAAVLAFNGVGAAVKALNEYQLDPTAENFAKVQQTLDKLGPAGQEFALAMQDLAPRLQQIKAVAEQGLLPGVADSIDEILKVQPQLQRVLGEISDSAGDVLAEAGDNLNDPRWRDFFGYLETTARPTLIKMGRTFGNFIEGMANVLMAVDPLSRDFASGFLRMSRAFNDWSQGLQGSQGFTEFVDYIRTSGPVVGETLGSLGDALLDLVEAAAPVGQVVLPVIQALAEALSAIAESPAGPLLLGTAAAVGVLGRSMALLRVAGLRPGENGNYGFLGRTLGVDKVPTILPAMRQVTAATNDLRVAQQRQVTAAQTARTTMFSLAPDKTKQAAMASYVTATRNVGLAQQRLASAEKDRQAAFRQGAGAFGRSAALVGGLAVATSGLADDTGLANSASLALMGTMAGPWGAAIGGGIGVVLDLAAANNTLEDSAKSLKLAMQDTWNFEGQDAALTNAKSSLKEYQGLLDDATSWGIGSPKATLTWFSDLFTNTGDEQQKAIAAAEDTSQQLQDSARALIAGYTGQDRYNTMPLSKMSDQLALVQAALRRRRLDIKDYSPGNPVQWVAYNDAILDYVKATDSVPGKSRAVGRALRDMQNDMIPTASAAERLKSAMDELFGVKLDVAGATTAWEQGLRDLRKQLQDTGDLAGTGKNALADQSLFQGQVQRLLDKFGAEAANDASGKKLTDTLVEGRDAIIETGKAAGLSEQQVSDYLDTLGLTPKNLVTLIQTSGVINASEEIRAVQRLYGLTPADLTTLLRADASGADGVVDRLMNKYDLTRRDVVTILRAVDKASGPLARIRQMLGRIPPVVTTTIRVNRVHSGGRGVGGFSDPAGILNADGNILERIGTQQPQVRPFGGPRGITWSEEGSGPWEAFISGHPAKLDRSRAIAAEVVQRLGGNVAFADGGIRETVRYRTPAAPVVVRSGPTGPLQVEGVLQTPFGPAQVRGVAREEARNEAAYAAARRRQGAR